MLKNQERPGFPGLVPIFKAAREVGKIEGGSIGLPQVRRARSLPVSAGFLRKPVFFVELEND